MAVSRPPTLQRSPEGGWVVVSPTKRKQRPFLSQRWVKVSALSQAVLVALAVFGYFHTVIPVYQNQVLAEQKAKLEKENTDLSKTIENDKQTIAKYDAQIADLQKKLTLVTSEYETTIAAKTRAEQELSSARKEEVTLQNTLVQLKASLIFQSFMAFMVAELEAALPNATSAFAVINSPEGSDVMKTIHAYLGDPYLDTRNLIVSYFDPKNKLFYEPEVEDSIRNGVKKMFLDELDALSTKIAIPEHVFKDCENIVEAYRTNRKPIEKERESLNIADFKSFADYHQKFDKLSQSILNLQNSAMKQLEDLKATQYEVFTVMSLVLEGLKQLAK
jgi:cell division protein FtsB